MTQLALVLPVIGQPDSTEDPKLNTALTTIQSWANGNVDSSNLTAATSVSAGINTSGTKVKGSFEKAGEDTRTNVAYGTMATADEVTGIVLPTAGKLIVAYKAIWWLAGAGEASIGLFLNAVQVKLAAPANKMTPVEVTIAGSSEAGHVATGSYNLFSEANTSTPATDVTTGQVIGIDTSSAGASTRQGPGGGSLEIFAAAGTYKVSLQFKSTASTVHVKNRHLWVEARSYS